MSPFDFENGKYGAKRENSGLYRIYAKRSFGSVLRGQKGGLVASPHNLSADGLCWIADNAAVLDGAVVRHNAIVCDNALVKKRAIVQNNAYIGGEALVTDSALVQHNARVYQNAKLFDECVVEGNAKIGGDVWIFDEAKIGGSARLEGKIHIMGRSIINLWPVRGEVIACFNLIITTAKEEIWRP